MQNQANIVYLHMGLAKTGTSSIQTMLSRNINTLQTSGFYYPPSESIQAAQKGRITSGNGVPLAKLLGVSLPSSITTDHITKEIEFARDSGCNILYSSEAISAFVPECASRFRDAVTGMGMRVRPIIYIRSVVDYALSYYSQLLKSGETQKRFLDYAREDFSPGLMLSPIKNAVEVFSADGIVFRNYDQAQNDINRDFLLSALCLEDVSHFDLRPAKVNRSLTAVETAIMREIAPVFLDAAQARVASDAMIFRDPQASPSRVISSEALRIITERCGHALEFINKYLVDAPVKIISSHIVVSDDPEPQLTEVEKALAAMMAGAIRFGKIRISYD